LGYDGNQNVSLRCGSQIVRSTVHRQRIGFDIRQVAGVYKANRPSPPSRHLGEDEVLTIGRENHLPGRFGQITGSVHLPRSGIHHTDRGFARAPTRDLGREHIQLAAVLTESETTDETVRGVERDGRDRFEFRAVFDFALIKGFEVVNDHVSHGDRQSHRLLGQLSQGDLGIGSCCDSVEQTLLVIHHSAS
jgi:hypothetical protein